MDVIKRESYHPFCMGNERNRVIDERGNETNNILVLVLHTRA
jgi:hypothetical protein